MRIGIDLGGTKIEAICLGDDGRVLLRRRVAAPRDDYAATLGAIRDLVISSEAELGLRAPPGPGCAQPAPRGGEGSLGRPGASFIGSVGIGMPGTISSTTGLVKNANSTWLIGRPLHRDLEAALERPVRVENDANCFAVSEATDGAAAGAETVFGVILGTGVGGGLVVGGRPLRGANGIAGEWGHNPLPWPKDAERTGPACYCGRQGCIETWLSGPGLARDAGLPERDSRALASLLATGADSAPAAFERYADRLARALASVINVFDPHVIVLGGGVSNLPGLRDAVTARWQRFVFSDTVETRLVMNRHGDSSGVRGAAWLWPPGA
ncbi:MAG: manno(fructo)kinase [Pseudomonadota bacterium]